MSPELVALGILLTLAILGVLVCITEDSDDDETHWIR